MKSAKTESKSSKKKLESMVRLRAKSLAKGLSQNEQCGIAAAQVALEMIVEHFQDEFPFVALTSLELFPCPSNCRLCRAAA